MDTTKQSTVTVTAEAKQAIEAEVAQANQSTEGAVDSATAQLAVLKARRDAGSVTGPAYRMTREYLTNGEVPDGYTFDPASGVVVAVPPATPKGKGKQAAKKAPAAKPVTVAEAFPGGIPPTKPAAKAAPTKPAAKGPSTGTVTPSILAREFGVTGLAIRKFVRKQVGVLPEGTDRWEWSSKDPMVAKIRAWFGKAPAKGK
jgi:hypothetical protein